MNERLTELRFVVPRPQPVRDRTRNARTRFDAHLFPRSGVEPRARAVDTFTAIDGLDLERQKPANFLNIAPSPGPSMP